MIIKSPILIAIVSLLFLSACKEFKFLSFNEKKPIANVGDSTLYLDQVKGIFPIGASRQDSLDLLNVYVNDWVKRMIKLQEAERLFVEDQQDIEVLINDYRNTLLTSKYNKIITADIDTAIKANEITEYYNANKGSFTLVSPIVKARIIILPKNDRQQKKIKELLSSSKENDYGDLLDLVKKNELKYNEYTSWTYFKEVVQQIPFNNKSFDGFLARNNYYQIVSDDLLYMMHITDYKATGDYIPQPMVEENIRRGIINQRKADKIKTTEQRIYQEALNKGILQIHIDSTFNYHNFIDNKKTDNR